MKKEDKEFKEYQEFKEFKKWKEAKDKEDNSGVGLILLVIVGIFVILLIVGAICGAVNKDSQNGTEENNGFNIISDYDFQNKPNNTTPNDGLSNNTIHNSGSVDGNSYNTQPQPYELSEAEKFLIGEWKIYDVGYVDDYPTGKDKAYMSDSELQKLFEKAESYYFNFDDTVFDYFGNVPTKNSTTDVFLNGCGSIGCCSDTKIFAKSIKGSNDLHYEFTHKPVNHNGFRTPITLWHLHYALDVDTVIGIRAKDENGKDILRITLDNFSQKDRVIWYEFARE